MGKKKSEEIRKLTESVRKFKKSKGFERMIIFGSYARGDFKKDSDVDILISDKRFKSKKPAERSKGLWISWHINQKIKKPVDFICYSQKSLKRRKKEFQ